MPWLLNWVVGLGTFQPLIWAYPWELLTSLWLLGIVSRKKIHKRLALWKINFISKGGMITLIKSTVASLLFYQMSLSRMSSAVTKRLEKLQRCFVCGGGARERKAHLVNWDMVCFEKRQGDIGLRKLTW